MEFKQYYEPQVHIVNGSLLWRGEDCDTEHQAITTLEDKMRELTEMRDGHEPLYSSRSIYGKVETVFRLEWC